MSTFHCAGWFSIGIPPLPWKKTLNKWVVLIAQNPNNQGLLTEMLFQLDHRAKTVRFWAFHDRSLLELFLLIHMRLELEGNFTSHAEQVRWLEQHRWTNTSSNWNHTLCMIVVVIIIIIIIIIINININHLYSSSIIRIHHQSSWFILILIYHQISFILIILSWSTKSYQLSENLLPFWPHDGHLRSRCCTLGWYVGDHQIHQLISRKRFKIQQLSWQSRGLPTRQLDQNIILEKKHAKTSDIFGYQKTWKTQDSKTQDWLLIDFVSCWKLQYFCYR